MINGYRPLICPACTTRIQDYGYICLSIMQKVCEASSQNDFVFYDEKEAPGSMQGVVKFLESKMLIVTTEVAKDCIGILPYKRSENYDYINNLFCWCPRKTNGESKLQSI